MPYLAQYTIRSKQNYIYKTNRLVEIVGASLIIRDSFSDLRGQAEKAGLKWEKDDGKSFSISEVRAKFASGELDAVELFCGGGNDTILYKDKEAFVRANEAYTRFVLENSPGLLPLCVGVEAPCTDYRAEFATLMKESDRAKSAMPSGRIESAAPFARKDATTLQTISVFDKEYRSAEADVKYKKGLDNRYEETKFLDKIARDDKRSLLAIVHADGNNMGIKIQKKLGDHTDYDFCVTGMREFTREIADIFTVKGRLALKEKLSTIRDNNADNLGVRWVVADGDDATFICNAKYALELTRAYLEGVSKSDPGYSACAGICVFHSHYPFARAYELAEQACDSAKEPIHKTKKEQAWVDFHYLRSGVGGDLDSIRSLHRTKNCIARPWFVCGENVEEQSLDKLYKINEVLEKNGVARTQIKNFAQELEASKTDAEMTWKRLVYNTDNLDRDSKAVFGDNDTLFRAMYDLGDFYDIWFAKRGGQNDGKVENNS